jgi:methylthioribose-1-phosphate isomerase
LLDYLFTSRPTAVNLGAAIKRLRGKLDLLVKDGWEDTRALAQEIIKEARLVADEDVDRNRLMSKYGAEWLLTDIAKHEKQLENGKTNV